MFKRVGLFLLTNIAVMVLLSIVVFVLERYLWISLSWNAYIFVVALVIWFGWAFISLALSKWMAKRAYNIVLITPDNLSSLDKKEKIVWNVVSDLADRNHIKMPEVGIYKDMDPNAFATGASKNSSLVAVSTWLLESMDEGAIEWVIAHEMAHVLNGDMVTMTLLQWVLNTFVIFFARVVANLIAQFLEEELSWLAYYGIVILLEIIFWIFASIIVMAFSRHREFKADEGSAKFVWKEKMIAWLEALKKMQHLAWWDKSKLASMKISTKKKWWIMALFSSHPDLDDRIKRLQDLSI